ncbi:hypothetical protein KP509_1Z238000 [Ceratopteris richardii]|nr:hypothetical protein KP509_1Z238000 [Ceratopteris richardii]
MSSLSIEKRRPLKIVGLAGSVRATSTNKGFLNAVIEMRSVTCLSSILTWRRKVPEVVLQFRRKVDEADAVIFASPEYNYSLPPALKNAIDWASRPPNVWAGKAAAVMSAAGGSGGKRSQYHLRQIGVCLDLHFINKPEVFVNTHEGPLPKFDTNGDLIDEEIRARVRQLLRSLHAFAIRLSSS